MLVDGHTGAGFTRVRVAPAVGADLDVGFTLIATQFVCA